MSKHINRAFSWLLVLTLVLTLLPQLPLTASAEGTAPTYRVDGVVYEDFQTAMTAAKKGSGLAVLASSGTLPTGSYTVPAGVTFVIPCMDNDTGYRTVGEGERFNQDGTNNAGLTGVGPDAYKYASLTVGAGTRITVYGDLMVNSVSGRPGGSGTECDVTGGYGQIDLEGTIVVAAGAKLNCFGYVKGSGMITALSGAEIGDLYIVRAWRGGSQAKEMYLNMIYPMNEYDCHNIECALRINYGASLIGRVKMYASGEYYYTSFPQVHVTNGLIRTDEGGYVIRTLLDGQEHYAMYGGADFAGSTLKVQGIELSTSDFLYPIDGDISFELNDGSYTFTEDYKFLPGTSVTVTEEAELAVEAGNSLAFYEEFNDVEHDGTEYPSDRPAAVLELEEGARFTNSGIFSGIINTESTEIFIGENPVWKLDTKEANGVAGSADSNYVTISHSLTINNSASGYSVSSSGSIVWDGCADYAKVQKAIAAIPKNMEYYYAAEGVSNVQTAVGQVIFDLPESEQAAVDAMAQPILDAVASLTARTITVHLDAAGGTITPDRLELACIGTYGRLPSPKRDCYKFAGWYDLEGNRVKNNQALKTRYDVTLVASWTPADADYDDLEDVLDLIPTDLSIYSAASVKALEDAQAAIDWKLTALDQAKVDAMTQTILDAIAGLDFEKVTVTLDPNGGSVAVTTMQVTYSKTMGTLPVPVREGYIFLGWTNAAGKTVTARSVVASLDPISLTALWEEEPPAPADYTAVEAALAAIPAELNVYTDASVDALLEAVDAVDYSLTEEAQASVDAMAKAITDAAAGLTGKTVTVTYNANGGKAKPATGEAVYGQPIGELVVPTRSGYNFVAWINTAGETVTADTLITSISDVVLKAQWEVIPPADYSALKAALDSVPSDLTAYTEDSAAAVEAAKNAIKWTYTEEDQDKVDTMTENLTAAVNSLQIRKVTVTFDPNGGTVAVSTRQVTYGSALGTLPQPEREDYIFKCWRDATGKKVTASSEAFNINGIQLIADWEPVPEVPADYSAVEAAIAAIPADLSDYTDESVAALTAAVNAVNYTLTDEDQAKVDAMAKAIQSAILALEVKTYTVTLDAAGGTCDLTDFMVAIHGALGELPVPEREGYLFMGWVDAAGRSVTADTVVTADLALTAVWLDNTVDPADYSAVKDAIAAIPADLTRYTDESVAALNQTVAAVDYTLDITRQADVDAMAQAITAAIAALEEKLFTVTFDAGEGICETASVQVPYGLAIGELPTATWEGYNFLGWLDASGSAVTEDTVITADMTLTASWEAKPLNAADYSAVEAAIAAIPADLTSYTEDSVAALNAAVNAVDYTLLSDRQADVDAMAQAITAAIAALEEKLFTVTFDAGEGICETASVQVPYGLAIGELPTATWEGYNFLGWLDASGSAVTEDTVITADMTLTASWEAKPLNAADYSAVEAAIAAIPADLTSYTEDSVAALNAAVNAVDYTLLSDRQADVDAMAQAITAAIAALEEKLFTVTFDAGEGICETASVQVPYGLAIGELPTATWEGYNFLGWLDASGSAVTEDTVITADMTLTASWERREMIVRVDEAGEVISVEINAKPGTTELTVPGQLDTEAEVPAVITVNVGEEPVILNISTKTVTYLNMVCLVEEDGTYTVLTKPHGTETGVQVEVKESCRLVVMLYAEEDLICPFEDVTGGNRFKPQILWAYYEGITAGKTATTFEPDADVTRAQFVTFLWRAAGQPEPASDENPFTDVSESNRFRTAILWAFHEGITFGTTKTTFSPDDTCTRVQVVTFLYRYAGSPKVETEESPFTDVAGGNRFLNAILWAKETGITSGKTNTTFDPSGNCTRAQVVAFLYRYLT